ncbi:MAG: hypothetical protein K0U68_12685 [Gammaproteobacteria bacterium]|nr:hypothetical protein [Gammaproteobacteria bacterium]
MKAPIARLFKHDFVLTPRIIGGFKHILTEMTATRFIDEECGRIELADHFRDNLKQQQSNVYMPGVLSCLLNSS